MNLLSGLEKFGLNTEKMGQELAQGADATVKRMPRKTPHVQASQGEKDYLYTKRERCTICQNTFEVKIVKTARLRRLQPDFDLRPRFQDIDTIKYDVYCCPNCGYAAMSRYFGHLTKGQINLVKEEVCKTFRDSDSLNNNAETFDIETAITRYKLALFCSVAKHAKESEKAYTCLKIAWLYRDLVKDMPENTEEEIAAKEAVAAIQEDYYKEAYEGLQRAVSGEDFPICGMDTYTMDYLLACLSFHFKQYSYASRAISNILGSQTADRRIKDRALDLKTYIVDAIRKESGGN